MNKLFAILLLGFYTSGSLFLPNGNFAYIEQMPKLYQDFSIANNETDFFEFLEEQFFEFEFDAGGEAPDEPYEKESKPVPFYALSASLVMALPHFESMDLNISQEQTTESNFSYILKDYWVHPSSVFHPPKVS